MCHSLPVVGSSSLKRKVSERSSFSLSLFFPLCAASCVHFHFASCNCCKSYKPKKEASLTQVGFLHSLHSWRAKRVVKQGHMLSIDYFNCAPLLNKEPVLSFKFQEPQTDPLLGQCVAIHFVRGGSHCVSIMLHSSTTHGISTLW